jgi:hypothetical protein
MASVIVKIILFGAAAYFTGVLLHNRGIPTPASVLQSRRQTELWLLFADAGLSGLPPRPPLHAPQRGESFEAALILYVHQTDSETG